MGVYSGLVELQGSDQLAEARIGILNGTCLGLSAPGPIDLNVSHLRGHHVSARSTTGGTRRCPGSLKGWLIDRDETVRETIKAVALDAPPERLVRQPPDGP